MNKIDFITKKVKAACKRERIKCFQVNERHLIVALGPAYLFGWDGFWHTPNRDVKTAKFVSYWNYNKRLPEQKPEVIDFLFNALKSH